jgi:hypothetical protein
MKTAALGLLLLGAAGLSEATTASGLREALRVATERAVASTSREGGFLDDPRIRIHLPGKLDAMAGALRAIGFGSQVDELEVGMNRAAERAAGEATPVFVDAIEQMSIGDAVGILRGGNTAATDYFQRKTTEPLRGRFRPIVDDAMRNVGVAQQYEALLGQYRTLPFASSPTLDLNGYVTDRALAGLFKIIGEEEKRIRKDPAARATDLLRQVFGK